MALVAARKPKRRALEEQIRDALRRDIQDAKISQNKVAEQAGLDRTSLSLKLSGERPLTIDEAQRIAEVLGKRFVDYIDESAAANPTVSFQRLRNAIGLQSTQWMRWVDQLEKAADALPANVIRLTRRMPIVGNIAAGTPILAEENYEGEVVFDQERHFMLRVRGDSMVDAGIHDGDMVHVLKTDDYRDGDVIAARVKGSDEATVKRFHLVGNGRVLLAPANKRQELAPAEYDIEDVAIEGKVLGAYRTMTPEPKTRRLRRVAERKTEPK